MRLISLICIVGLAACQSDVPTNQNNLSGGPIDDTAPALETTPIETSNAVETAAPVSNWEYREERDEMRGSTSRFATVQSTNTVSLGFPYGDVRAQIVVRERTQDGLEVMLTVDSGQILCRSFSNDSHISAKFDRGPIERFGCVGPDSGSSEVAFIQSGQSFLRKLKSSSSLMVEADFYNSGPQQFSFNTEGLRWE